MPAGRQQVSEVQVDSFGGLNTALPLSRVPSQQSPLMINGYMSKIGALAKRPGSIPVAAKGAWTAGTYLTVYYTSTGGTLLARFDNTLYKFDPAAGTLTAVTMTNALTTGKRMTATAFTDQNSSSILFIADGGPLKSYNGTAVANITPATNDASPGPANIMATINGKGPLFAWTYSSYVFVSDGSDTAWYSKRFLYNYFPEVNYERWVRENDRIVAPGVTFNNVCLIPMRRGWGILTGVDFESFNGNQFLNTNAGVAAGRTIARLTYPDGTQAIAYVSDDGVYEIYDTGFQDTGSRQYSTRCLTTDKLAWDFNFTQADYDGATAYYDTRLNLYMVSIGTNLLCYDARNAEWYKWTGIQPVAILRMDNVLYFIDSSAVLKKIDTTLFSDWTNTAKSTGTPVEFDRYGPLMGVEFTGFASVWDEYLLEAKEFAVASSLDISVAFGEVKDVLPSTITASAFIWGVSKWGAANYTTGQYTDVLFEPTTLKFYRLAKYAQVRWYNNRDEPVEIFKEKWKVRLSGG